MIMNITLNHLGFSMLSLYYSQTSRKWLIQIENWSLGVEPIPI